MNITIRSMLLSLLVAFGAPALAAHHEAGTVADILTGMNHFPSESEKQTLTAIGNDEAVSDNLRTIAMAVASVQHQVPDSYQAELEAIAADPAASDVEKTLAGAALRFNHKLAAEDSSALMALTE